MDVLAGYHSIDAVHPGVAMICWDGDRRPSPLAPAGFLARGVHLVDGPKGRCLAWRDGAGQRIYLLAEDLGRNADGARMFRSLDPEYLTTSITLAFYGADELTAVARQLRWREIPWLQPDEIPYVLGELLVGND